MAQMAVGPNTTPEEIAAFDKWWEDFSRGRQQPSPAQGSSILLVNPRTGEQQQIPLDGTPQTSELINTLFQQGFVQEGPGAPPLGRPEVPQLPPRVTPPVMAPEDLGPDMPGGPQPMPTRGTPGVIGPDGPGGFTLEPMPTRGTPPLAAPPRMPPGFGTTLPTDREMQPTNIGGRSAEPLVPTVQYEGDRLGPANRIPYDTALEDLDIDALPPSMPDLPGQPGTTPFIPPTHELRFTRAEWDQLTPEQQTAVVNDPRGYDVVTTDQFGRPITSTGSAGPLYAAPPGPSDYYQGPGSSPDQPISLPAPAIRPGMPPGFGGTALGQGELGQLPNEFLAPGPGLLDPTRSPGNLVPGATPPQGPGAGTSISLSHPTTGQTQTIVLDGTPETSALLNDLMQNQGFVLDDPGRPPEPFTPPVDPPPVDPPITQPITPPPPGSDYGDFGTYATPEIPPIDLPPTERVPSRFGQDFDQWYSDVIDAQAGNLARYYDFPTPQAGVAMMDLGMVPQPGAQTPEQFEALQFLLSGQGYDPATMARMRAGATDAAAMAGRSGAGAARLMGQQAGLAGSPAALALEAGARRRQGDVTTRALNQIEIQNAMQGMQNRLTGAGMELNRQTSGAAMANQMALSNASNILGAMQQNVGNLQQSNLFNVGNLMGQRMTQAGQQTGLYGQGAQAYNQAALGLAGQAPFFNVANQNAWANRQAELARQRDLANAGLSFERYSGDRDWLGRLSAGTGAGFFGLGGEANQGVLPGSVWAGLGLPSLTGTQGG
jgi:hypothetical protein